MSGVRDLQRQRDFYRRLRLPQIVDDVDFAAFELRGAVLALFPVQKLAADGRADPEPGRGGIRFTIGIVVGSASAVDRLADQFRDSGGRVSKEPVDAEFFEGRSAYVADPEGNFFEIVWLARTTPSWQRPTEPPAKQRPRTRSVPGSVLAARVYPLIGKVVSCGYAPAAM